MNQEINGSAEGYVIEQGIPIPERKKGGAVVEFLKAMKIGDSTVIQKTKAAAWHSTARYCNCRVATRVISKTESRVWRIE